MYESKKHSKHIVIIIILSVLLLFSGALSIYSSIESNQLRAANDQLTERLDRATNTCNELRGTITNCQSICRDIDEISGRSISNAREAIEIIEETRYYVMCLEVELGLIDSDSIYERIDNWLESEGVILDE